MKREEFDELFEELVAAPLVDVGYSEKGKSFYRFRKSVTIGFMRGGGRLASPGCATWVLGVRHPFVWTHTPEEPACRKSYQIAEFPMKFRPIGLSNGTQERTYDHKAIMGHCYETLPWGTMERNEVSSILVEMTSYLIDDFTPWAEQLDPSDLAAQIRSSGGEYWVEKFWLGFYDKT